MALLVATVVSSMCMAICHHMVAPWRVLSSSPAAGY